MFTNEYTGISAKTTEALALNGAAINFVDYTLKSPPTQLPADKPGENTLVS